MSEFTWEVSTVHPDQLKPVPEISPELKADRKKLAERLRGIPSYQTVYSKLIEERFPEYLKEHASDAELIKLGKDIYHCEQDIPYTEPNGRLSDTKRDIVTAGGHRTVITREQKEQAQEAYDPYLLEVGAAANEVVKREPFMVTRTYRMITCTECNQQVCDWDRTINRNAPDDETTTAHDPTAAADSNRHSISIEEFHYLESHPERSQVSPAEWQQFLNQS